MVKCIINSNIKVTESMENVAHDMVSKLENKYAKHIKENPFIGIKNSNNQFEVSLKIPVKGNDIFVTSTNKIFHVAIKELHDKAVKFMDKLN